MAREHASVKSSSAVPFSRSWTTANTSLTNIETFASCLSKLPPIPSRVIIAAALSQSADDFLQTINQSFANLLDWPAVVAHAAYPHSSLPPDHHPLDTSSLSSCFVSFSNTFPHDSTAHTPIELAKLGLHFPPNSGQTKPAGLTPVATIAHYDLQSHMQPVLDYPSEFDPDKPSQARSKQKPIVPNPYITTPASKPKRHVDVFATIPIGRNKSSLGSPNLARRNRNAASRPPSDLRVAAKRLKVAAGIRPTPCRTTSGPIEVINLDDDVDTDNFTLSGPAPQASAPKPSLALRSQPPPTPSTETPSSQLQTATSHPQLQTRSANGTEGNQTNVVQAELPGEEDQLGSNEVIVARSKPLPEEIDAVVGGSQIASETQEGAELQTNTHEPETQDMHVADIVPEQAVVGSGEVDAAAGEDSDGVIEVPTTQTGNAAGRTDSSFKELKWKKKPNLDDVINMIRETKVKEDMKKTQRKESVKDELASLPDTRYTALQRRNEIQEKRKSQADKAAEKRRKAQEKAMEKRRKIARRKRRAAAKAKGEVYNSESEENTDPAEPEDNDTRQYSQPGMGPTNISGEVIDLDGNGESSSIGQPMRPSPISGYSPQAKRQRLDNQDQRYRLDRPPNSNGSTFSYPHEYRDQSSWQKGVGNRGMPPAQYAYTGGSTQGKGPMDRLNSRGINPAQGLPRYWSTPEKDPEGQVMHGQQHAPQRQMPPPTAPFQAPQSSSPLTPSNYPETPTQHVAPMHHHPDAQPPSYQMEQKQGRRPSGPYGTGSPSGSSNPFHPRNYGGRSLNGGERRRLTPPLFEKKRKELLDQIRGVMGDLQPQDRITIEDFLDNQRYMFAPGETEKDFRLQLRNRILTKLRLNGETGEWIVVRARV
eukprot:GFKZ01006689.1.p1 GENE.GFKZ01006689.1~~GFKZ01006689.1.p1  ORF type:complete len:876 (-),score=104.85 GFKZ01006689.1:1962-4589(-)